MPEQTHPRPAPLSARLAGGATLGPSTLFSGVPPHLAGPLQAWARVFLSSPLEERVAIRLRVRLDGPTELGEALAAVHGRGPRHLVERLRDPAQLLDAVDMALQLDPMLDYECRILGPEPVPWELPPTVTDLAEIARVPWHWPDTCPRAQAVDRLAELLADADSLYTVEWHPHPPRLATRSDPTAARAAEHAIATAGPTASQLLRSSWNEAHRLHPDPTTAYRDAVRAVEQVACPLVLPADGTATLGKVIAHLRQGGHKWVFTLVDRDGVGTVDPLVAMLDRLWTGQVSRHGGGQNSRNQSTEEAQAAVHLAATLVQLLGAGALTRRAVP